MRYYLYKNELGEDCCIECVDKKYTDFLTGKEFNGDKSKLVAITPAEAQCICNQKVSKPMILDNDAVIVLIKPTEVAYTSNAKRSKEIGIVMIMILLFPAIVFLQRDVGTASILFGIFFVLFIFCPLTIKEKATTFFLLAGVISMMLVVIITINGHVLNKAQSSRLSNFYNPCAKYEQTGYQVCNAFIAINNGILEKCEVKK